MYSNYYYEILKIWNYIQITASQQMYQKAQEKEEIAQLKAQIAELHERDRRREEQMELLKQRLVEYIAQHGTTPSSSGGESWSG